MLGVTDLPCQPEQDTLGINPYVKGLTAFICDCPTPMSVALQGDWGTGKTTVVFKLIDALKASGANVKTVYFNTWQYSQFNMSESLYASFMHSLAEKLGNQERIKETFLNATRTLAFGAAERITGVGQDKWEDVFRAKTEKVHAIESLKNDFQKLVNSLVGESGRLVIFIDDLDRLNPETAVELLEVIKLFLDVEKCIFVLAIDYDVVVSGVKKKFGTDISEEKCRSFFDKIIQLPFRMPVETYDLQGMLNETLHEYLDSRHIEVLSDIIRATLGTNPRAFKRLANSFFLIYSVQRYLDHPNTAVVEKQQNALLLCSLCLQMCVPHLYSSLLSSTEDDNPNDFLNEACNLDGEDQEARQRVVAYLQGLDSMSEQEWKMCPVCAAQIKNVLEVVLNGFNEKSVRQFLDVLKLSAITGVEQQQKRAPSIKVCAVTVKNGDALESTQVVNATEALVYTFKKILLSHTDDEIEAFVQKHSNLVSRDRAKGAGFQRAKKELGEGLYLGVSTSTSVKMSQANDLCDYFGCENEQVQWFGENGQPVYSYQKKH